MGDNSKEVEAAVADRTEADWLFSQNLATFSGQWVAVLNKKILAHGHELKKVHAEALARLSPRDAKRLPLFYSVPTGMSGGT
ncbi:MAG: DUF5678 domain-containing protein [Candidatus Lutacidiplasmatales archaeon]